MLTELYIVVTIFFVALAFLLGKVWGQYQLIKQMFDNLSPGELEAVERAIKEDRSEVQDGSPNGEPIVELVRVAIIPLRSETIGDQLYLYRADDGTFAAQGDCLEVAAQVFAKRFPGKIGRISGGDGQLYIVNGAVSGDQP